MTNSKRTYKKQRSKNNLPSWLDSNRTGHMFAATTTGVALLMGASITGWGWMLPLSIGVPLWEWACTPDVDLASKRRPKGLLWTLICTAWLPYSWVVPHRSEYSHSLLFGTPCRLLYVVGIFLAASHISGKFDAGLLLLQSHWSVIAGSAIAGDAIHLLKDGYGPRDLLIGR